MGSRSNSVLREHSADTTAQLRVADRCPDCDNFLCGSYYRVNGKMTCVICAIQALARRTNEFRTSSVLGRMCGMVGAKPLSFDKLDGPYRV
jgi:hypothetical protein